MKNRKGQNFLEYCIFIFVLVAALISMQVYIKRGIQGRLRQSADDVGEQFDAYNTSSQITSSVTGKSTTNTWLELQQCADGANCIPNPLGDGRNYLDLNGDGKIDDRDYVTKSTTNIPSDNPEKTVRTGTEQVGQFGALYDK